MEGEPTEEVDVRAIVEDFETTVESDLEQDIRKMAWVSAYHLPCYPLWLNADEFGMNTTHFEHATPAPDFSQYGGNYGLGTAQHNLLHTTAKPHHYYRGFGTGDQFTTGDEPGRAVWAKEE